MYHFKFFPAASLGSLIVLSSWLVGTLVEFELQDSPLICDKVLGIEGCILYITIYSAICYMSSALPCKEMYVCCCFVH